VSGKLISDSAQFDVCTVGGFATTDFWSAIKEHRGQWGMQSSK